MTAPTPFPPTLHISHKLLRKWLTLCQRPPLPQQPPQIIPRALILRRQPYLPLCKFHFPIQEILIDDIAHLVHSLAGAGIDVLAEEDEPAVVPGAVVADIGGEEAFDVGEFGVPEGEVADEPLAVGPDVVVFGVFGEHAGDEGELGGGEGGEMGHEGLTVVPGI